jgi:predicted phosphodiesterase
MRLWIFSDLHIEFSRQWALPVPTDFDVIIAAGDIHNPVRSGVRWLAELAGGKPVIYVPGNHEWYSIGGKFNVVDESRRASELAAQLGVHWLVNSEVVIGGVRFLGSTLWTDYQLYGDVDGAMRAAERGLNDHRYIFPDTTMMPLNAAGARAWHMQSRHWLAEKLADPTALPTVVVTHHLPHPGSIDPKYAGSPLNPALCSDLSALIEPSGAALWVHGHTHSSCDYRAGSTRVLCNPKGYGPTGTSGQIENPEFNPALVVDLL